MGIGQIPKQINFEKEVLCMVATGNVVKEMSIGNTRIKICDDYCQEKTKAEVEEILKRIARNAIGPLTVATTQSV